MDERTKCKKKMSLSLRARLITLGYLITFYIHTLAVFPRANLVSHQEAPVGVNLAK